jgi:hypothetical protein
MMGMLLVERIIHLVEMFLLPSCMRMAVIVKGMVAMHMLMAVLCIFMKYILQITSRRFFWSGLAWIAWQ